MACNVVGQVLQNKRVRNCEFRAEDNSLHISRGRYGFGWEKPDGRYLAGMNQQRLSTLEGSLFFTARGSSTSVANSCCCPMSCPADLPSPD
jgi:hypothetical protein